MLRLALSFLFVLCVVVASSAVAAKTAVSGLQPPELPCPTNRGDSLEYAAPGSDTNAAAAAISRSVQKAQQRQRWKALLPGTLKSAT